MGEVDTPTGVMGIMIGITMGYFAFVPPWPFLPYVFLGVSWAAVMLYPAVRAQIERQQLLAIDIDMMERAYDQLRERSDNMGAKIKLARLIYNRGLGGHSIALVESALRGLPEHLFEEEHKQVDMWKRQLGSASRFRSLPCLECGIPNEPGLIHCKRCGAPYLIHHARGKFLGPQLTRRIVVCWGVAMLLGFGIPWSHHHLTGIKPLIAICGLITLSIFALVVVFVPRGKNKK